MASWRDNLRPASFKGIPFEVLTDETPFGRRSVIHEFPYRDEAEAEDLGRKYRHLKVEAVIKPGADYMARRDALMKVIEQESTPGVLIHPYLGEHWVMPGDCSVTHSSSEGGWCHLSLEFIQVAKANKQPAQSTDTTYVALSSIDDLHAQAQTDLASGFTIASQPSFVTTAATDLIGQVQSTISDAAKTLTGYGAGLNSFVAQGLAIKRDALKLAETPVSLASQLSGLIQGLFSIAATPQALLGVLEPLMSFGGNLLAVGRTTPARMRQADNQDVIVQFIQRTAAAEAVKAVAATTFSSYEDAIAARIKLDDAMDTLAINAADLAQDDTYAALETARQAMIADVTARGGSLQHLYGFTPQASIPAVILAYRLFSDIDSLEDNFADLVERNGIIHPGFVPGGQTLEVLTDG